MANFELKDAKKLAAGFKSGLPSNQHVEVDASITLKSEDGDYLVLKVIGSPPFLQYKLALNGEVNSYLGHEELS